MADTTHSHLASLQLPCGILGSGTMLCSVLYLRCQQLLNPGQIFKWNRDTVKIVTWLTCLPYLGISLIEEWKKQGQEPENQGTRQHDQVQSTMVLVSLLRDLVNYTDIIFYTSVTSQQTTICLARMVCFLISSPKCCYTPQTGSDQRNPLPRIARIRELPKPPYWPPHRNSLVSKFSFHRSLQ